MIQRIVVLALGGFLLAGSAASAQPFGRNKVQYGNFDFRVLETPHFDIYYYPSEHDAVLEAGRMAERWYTRLSAVFDHTFRERQPIVLYASHSHFTQTTVLPGFLGDGVGGVTEHHKGRIVLPFASGLGETDHVLGHELVHAFQRDILRQNGRSIANLPLWFVEGMAEYLSLGRIDSNTAMWLRDSVEQKKLPPIDELDKARWFPYRYGQALWAYLAGRFGDDVVARCLRSPASGGAVGRIVATTGVDVRTLSNDWHESVRHNAALPRAASGSDRSDTIIARKNGGVLNVGAALSPDGKTLVFLSERDQFSIDVFLADASTGEIKRKIVETAVDPHFDSLQFIESAGAWSPDGRQFALAALSQGQPVLTILDMQTGDVAREIRLSGLDQVFNPTWSPGSDQIAFSALKGGLSDLYVVHLESGTVRELTSDPFADFQPSWSPDGRTIVFSTDRFSSSIETLSFGQYRLGALDVESGAIRELPAIPAAKNIDPHWSADGADIYFVADADSVSNVFRLSVANGALFQVTNVTTGVSGVTALSPALSVAQRGDRLVFSVYRDGGYEIHGLSTSRGTPVLNAAAPATTGTTTAGTTSARLRPSADAVTPPALGLIDSKDFSVKPYRRGLNLDGMVQPYLSAGGGGGTGSFIRGGVALSFDDMLGDQQMQTALQVGKGLNDFVAEAAYVNLRSRWNWGISGGQLPWVIGSSQLLSSPSATTGDATITRTTSEFRQVHRHLSAQAIYPFSSATRLELTGGVHTISFDRESTVSVFSGATRDLLNETKTTDTAAPPARLIETGVALVHDTAVVGPTSPMLGTRYRFEFAPTLGTIRVATVAADYRRYFMPVRPVTIAVRAQQVGRFGVDSGDSRLLPLVWTLRDVVRGYGDTYGLTRSCGAGAAADCASLSYLSAQRMMVGNIELRAPLPGVFHHSVQPGPLPLEGLVFFDAGAFWNRKDGTDGSNPRTVLRSVGAGVRLNAAGFVFEFDAVRPLDLPSRGWTFAVNFRPGF